MVSLESGANVKEQKYIKEGVEETLISSTDSILVFDIPRAQNDKEYISHALGAGLYDLLKDKTFTEYTGVYYETDSVSLDTDVSSLGSSTQKDSVSVANKDKARVITYIEK